MKDFLNAIPFFLTYKMIVTDIFHIWDQYKYKLMFNVFSSTTVLQDMTKPAVNAMLLHFGQFIGHDITLTPEQGGVSKITSEVLKHTHIHFKDIK